MPLNKLKKYPELLELDHLGERERNESLKGIFNRDIVDNDGFAFRGKRIYPIKSDSTVDLEREFMHLTTEETEETDEDGKVVRHRAYDRFRSERLHWIRTHIDEKVTDSDIAVFDYTERNVRKRTDVRRTYIYNKTRKYVIALEPQRRDGGSYYLLTAYYLNREYGEKEMKNKLKSEHSTVI